MQRVISIGKFVRGQTRILSLFGAVAAFVLLAAVLPITGAEAQLASVKSDTEGAFAGEFKVPLNKSQILRVDQRFGDLRLGNSAIADVVPLTDRTIYVLGKAVGGTSLTILGTNGRLLAVVDLMVTFDAQGVKAKLAEIVPSSRVEVRAVNNALILSGEVSSSIELARVISVAETFAPNSIRNLIRVTGSQQVLLKVRFAEMGRTAAKELGIDLDAIFGDFSFSTVSSLVTDSFLQSTLSLTPSDNSIDAALNAMEHSATAGRMIT